MNCQKITNFPNSIVHVQNTIAAECIKFGYKLKIWKGSNFVSLAFLSQFNNKAVEKLSAKSQFYVKI